MIPITFEIVVTYGILTLALASLWLPKSAGFSKYSHWVWLACLVVAAIAGMLFDFLRSMSLLWMTVFGVSVWKLNQKDAGLAIKHTVFVTASILSIGLLMHQLPGFANPKIIAELRLSKDALPYNKYLNFDSALVGLVILGFGHNLITKATEWLSVLKQIIPTLLVTMLTMTLMSLVLGYAHWQPKWTPIFFIWAWGNLFFTCIAEEAFFRGFIQRYLNQGLSKARYGGFFAILIAALLFGCKHYAGGYKYILLASVAGVGYGWAYHQTQRIEAAILTHFSLNSLHFLLFTYPALASSV